MKREIKNKEQLNFLRWVYLNKTDIEPDTREARIIMNIISYNEYDVNDVEWLNTIRKRHKKEFCNLYPRYTFY